MRISRLLSWFVLLFVVVVMACSTAPPRELVERNDHSGLTAWYEQEAIRLKGKAEEMRQMAERYAVFSSPHLSPKETKADLIAHCRSFMQYYTKKPPKKRRLSPSCIANKSRPCRDGEQDDPYMGVEPAPASLMDRSLLRSMHCPS